MDFTHFHSRARQFIARHVDGIKRRAQRLGLLPLAPREFYDFTPRARPVAAARPSPSDRPDVRLDLLPEVPLTFGTVVITDPSIQYTTRPGRIYRPKVPPFGEEELRIMDKRMIAEARRAAAERKAEQERHQEQERILRLYGSSLSVPRPPLTPEQRARREHEWLLQRARAAEAARRAERQAFDKRYRLLERMSAARRPAGIAPSCG